MQVEDIRFGQLLVVHAEVNRWCRYDKIRSGDHRILNRGRYQYGDIRTYTKWPGKPIEYPRTLMDLEPGSDGHWVRYRRHPLATPLNAALVVGIVTRQEGKVEGAEHGGGYLSVERRLRMVELVPEPRFKETITRKAWMILALAEDLSII